MENDVQSGLMEDDVQSGLMENDVQIFMHYISI